jgi:hypothetical protein
LIILPIGLIFLYFVGYASLATISVSGGYTPLAILAIIGKTSWLYILYGIGATALVAWSLRPNIRRLLAGTERWSDTGARKLKKEPKESKNWRAYPPVFYSSSIISSSSSIVIIVGQQAARRTADGREPSGCGECSLRC